MVLMFSKSNDFLGKNLVPIYEIVSIANAISHTNPFPKQTISNKQILSIDAE